MSTIKKTTVKKTNVKNTATETPAAVVKTTVKKEAVKAPAKVTAKKEVTATPVAKKVTEKAPVTAVKPAVKATTVKATTPKAETKTTAKAKTATKKITFSLPAAAVNQAKKVGLVGDFNGWDVNKPIELKKQKDGSFATTLDLNTGSEYQYRFLINGEVWENDWKADKYVPTPFGTFNSVITVA